MKKRGFCFCCGGHDRHSPSKNAVQYRVVGPPIMCPRTHSARFLACTHLEFDPGLKPLENSPFGCQIDPINGAIEVDRRRPLGPGRSVEGCEADWTLPLSSRMVRPSCGLRVSGVFRPRV